MLNSRQTKAVSLALVGWFFLMTHHVPTGQVGQQSAQEFVMDTMVGNFPTAKACETARQGFNEMNTNPRVLNAESCSTTCCVNENTGAMAPDCERYQ